MKIILFVTLVFAISEQEFDLFHFSESLQDIVLNHSQPHDNFDFLDDLQQLENDPVLRGLKSTIQASDASQEDAINSQLHGQVALLNESSETESDSKIKDQILEPLSLASQSNHLEKIKRKKTTKRQGKENDQFKKIRRGKSYVTNPPYGSREKSLLRSNLARHLGEKLASRLNVDSAYIPWISMKASDIISWPPEVPFAPPARISINGLKLLNNLIKEDKLDFSNNFLVRLSSDKTALK